MAKKKVSLQVSNTFRGSTDRSGEFIREEDRNGRWIPSNNIRIVTDTTAVLPAVLTAKHISSLVDQKPGLQVVTDTDYRRTNKVDFDGDADTDREPAIGWYYSPVSAPVTLEL